MFLFWKIRYLDRADKQFKDRCLYLNTKALDPVTRAAVEIVVENRSANTQREILKYRHLFAEGVQANAPRDPHELDIHRGFCLPDYFEDETCREITLDEMAQSLTGSPTARAIPRGAKQHDFDLMFAEPKPIPLDEVSLSAEATRLFGYFVRDLEEMQNSAFMKDGPGTLTSSGVIPTITTAVTDEEIRSFVTIFRRLYMTSERDPANFLSTVAMFVKVLGNHPYSKWVESTANEYKAHLAAKPDAIPIIPNVTFPTKRLIDVFLYTQYAHQPDAKRQRQFEECLAELHGKGAVLTWLFLTEMWKCSLEIGNAGNVISWWFKHYCHHHSVSPDVLKSLRDHHSGLCAAEKEEDRRERLFHEKVEQLAAALWEQAGRPEGGPTQFLVTDREQLCRKLKG
jgi:hypothetical protein